MPAAATNDQQDESSGLKVAMTQEVKMTVGEQTALMDRLELCDTIAEVLGCEEELWKPFQHQSSLVEERCQILVRLCGGTGRTIPPVSTEVDKAILVEAIEGTTYIAQVSDEPQLCAARRRVVNSVARKMIAAGIADEINVPSN